MGILSLIGLVLIVLAILKLVGVLTVIGATWVALLVVGIILLLVSAFVWDLYPRRGPVRRW